jgi:hypothetical protein
MEFDFTKLAIGFGLIMVVGFVIVGTTRETQQEKIQGALLQTSSMLNSLALSKCTEAVKENAGTHPYTPSESSSDNLLYVNLIWNNVGTVKRAECRYVIDQGITLLKLDDRTVVQKEALGNVAGPTTSVHHQ